MSVTGPSAVSELPFLQGGGEMGELIRALDWPATAIGAPGDWPVALKQTVSMMLTTTFPVLVCWGEDYIQLYNNAFRPINGQTKHPQALGGSARDTYSEIWDIIGPMFAGVMQGNAVGFPDFLVPLDRYGYLEDCFFDFSYSPIRDTQGAVHGILVICMETTEKIRALNRLKLNQANTENMIRQAPVGMCMLLGTQHVITVANQLIIELWGKPAAEVMYKPIFEALPDAREQGLEQLLHDVYETGISFKADERPVSLLRNDRQEIVYQNFVYEPYKDTEGNILGVVAITVDVTQQVVSRQRVERSEAELLATKKRLEAELENNKRIQAQKDTFIGIASHELKTPLTSMTAILQVLQAKLKTNTDAFIPAAVEKANNQAKKMNNMINSFLNISRLESGHILIEKKDFILNNLIINTIEEINLTMPGHHIIFVPCKPITVSADSDRLSSVLSNLLSNAVKYSPQGQKIIVSCQMADGGVTVSIKDKGIGISGEHLESVFDRYYRVESGQTRHISGFGLGLYLSAEIIRQHGGKIWVNSKPGVGSTFYFSLPLPR